MPVTCSSLQIGRFHWVSITSCFLLLLHALLIQLNFWHTSLIIFLRELGTYSVNDRSDSDGVEGIVRPQRGTQLEERVPGGVGAEAR